MIVVYITDTSLTSYVLPSDFSGINTIEAIGGGGGGNAGGNPNLEAGGGGEYRKLTNVSNGARTTVSISVGIGGIGGTGSGEGANGGNTNWDSDALIAVGGNGGTGNGMGGANGTGGIGYNGGNSGQTGVLNTGSGGGGAAGPHGAGGWGGDANTSASGAGAGGGGSGGGGAGSSPSGTTGGKGGANYTASKAGGVGGTSIAGNGGPGTSDSNGASGGGGAGQASGATGGAGASGQEWDATHGSGAGGGAGGTAGGSSAGPAGHGGLYGGGGGPGAKLGNSAGGNGGQGIIVITYTPTVTPFIDAQITTDFLARTSGLDATHTQAYKDFINGLVLDGVCTNTTWGKFDCIYIFGTQNATTALLNLPSATYNAKAVGSPTFTADQGYTGAASKYISTGFTPSTASSPNFTQNTASIGIYDRTSRTSASSVQMGTYDGAGKDTEITLWYGDNTRVFSVNGTGASDGAAAATQGSWFVNRSVSNATQVYHNGVSYLTGGQTSGAVSSREILISCVNDSGTPAYFSTDQIAAAWIGGNFTATEIVIFQHRLNVLATSLGWNTY